MGWVKGRVFLKCASGCRQIGAKLLRFSQQQTRKLWKRMLACDEWVQLSNMRRQLSIFLKDFLTFSVEKTGGWNKFEELQKLWKLTKIILASLKKIQKINKKIRIHCKIFGSKSFFWRPILFENVLCSPYVYFWEKHQDFFLFQKK